MARKPNYALNRNNRAKAKAAKREAKRQAKLAARTQKADATSAEEIADDSPAGTAATSGIGDDPNNQMTD